ncbi:hypothetical protein [Colletotrichum gloeosporioides polymycovirus virus 1]|nr:hypothetical protein [Colletotrichum gloeosporioides polymycovirus virus 1]
MSSNGFKPAVKSFRRERDREIRDRYGDYEAMDVTSYVMGLSSDLPDHAPCGCRVSNSSKAKLLRSRLEFQENEKEGRKLYAMLGSFANGDAGPLVTSRLDDGTVIVVISPTVAKSNPTMEVVDGDVRICSKETVKDDMRTAPPSSSAWIRAAENLTGRSSRFKVIESVRGGTSVTVNSLRTYDYSLVHPKDKCSIFGWIRAVADRAIYSGGDSDSCEWESSVEHDDPGRRRRRRRRRSDYPVSSSSRGK